jgi:hypothetical protein
MNSVAVKIAGLICTLHRFFLAVTRRKAKSGENEGPEEYVLGRLVSRICGK